jgi:hypothetical protein
VILVDSAEAAAAETAQLLEDKGMLRENGGSAQEHLARAELGAA